MIITNFASGELSKTLYGRIDLPQYFQGVSRLENFDVIPSGGLERRRGLRRIMELPGEGRIIPFIINRERHTLLYLQPQGEGFVSAMQEGDNLRGKVFDIPVGKTPEGAGSVTFTYTVTDEAGDHTVTGQWLHETVEGVTRFYSTAPEEVEFYNSGKVPAWSNDGIYVFPDDKDYMVTGVDVEHSNLFPVVPLVPARISVIRNGENGFEITSTVESDRNVPLPRTMEEIHEVKYAQNNEVMILVQENYAPIEIRCSGDLVFILLFDIKFLVKNIKNKGIEDTETVFEYDELYYNKHLTTSGNYPRAVTFLNGRLVFAGTKNSPQRLFFSTVDDIHNFTTYKIYLTENKNYTVVQGSAEDNSDKITVTQTEPLQFFRPLDEYTVDSIFFPPFPDIPEKTKIISFLGREITVNQRSRVGIGIQPYEQEALDQLADRFTTYNDTIDSYGFHYCNLYIGSSAHLINGPVYVYAGSNSIKLIGNIKGSNGPILETHTLPENVGVDIENQTYLFYFLKSIIDTFTYSFTYLSGDTYNKNDAGLLDFATHWSQRLQESMKFIFRGQTYYGTASNIYARIQNLIQETSEIYIPLYTREVITDRYPSPDDGFTFEIASDMSDAIKWIGQNKHIIAGTETAEWIIPSGVTATNIQAQLNSRYGSDMIQGIAAGDAMIFIQTGRKGIVEYYIPQQDNNFRANNMAMLCKEMLLESKAYDIDFISAPYTKLFVTREDGACVTLLYERGTGTFAWGRITTNGFITSVATMPGEGRDEVYVLVRRANNRFFLERIDDQHSVFLDSWAPYRAKADVSGYWQNAVIIDLDGRTYKASAAPEPVFGMTIGYEYTSRVRSMPILANDQMKQNVIKTLDVRFLDSYLPRITSLINEAGHEHEVKTDTISRQEPYSGIIQIPFMGRYERDVYFEFVHDKPNRCVILSVNAEVN